MKRLMAGFCLFSLLVGCSPKSDSQSVSVLIPWPQADHSYSMTRVELSTISNIHSLSGSILSMHSEPQLATLPTFATRPFQGRFARKSDGLYIPTDEVTLQATTIYAHLEQLYLLDRELGIEGLGQWPIAVGVKTQLITASGHMAFNNAVYDAYDHSLLFSPLQSHDLGVTYNAGVVGHEHFHAIWHQLVNLRLWPHGIGIKPIEDHLHFQVPAHEACPRLSRLVAKEIAPAPIKDYNAYVLRALNEGLADFWGYLYTDHPTYLNPSFPAGQLGFRALSDKPRAYLSTSMLTEYIDRFRAYNSDAICLSYDLGASVANTLYRAVRALDYATPEDGMGVRRDMRIQMAKAILRALPKIADRVIANDSRKVLDVRELLIPIWEELPKKKDFCETMSRDPGARQFITCEART